jgi:hypothetical protein
MQNGRTKAVPRKAEPDPSGLSDADLVNAAAEGHEWAWNLLVGRFAPSVWSVARAGDLADHEAAEVFRLTWLRTADRLSLLSPSSIGRWLQDTAELERTRITVLQQVGVKT